MLRLHQRLIEEYSWNILSFKMSEYVLWVLYYSKALLYELIVHNYQHSASVYQ